MHHIFISYKREERAIASRLATALEEEGWSVWWDIELTGGEVFTDVIEAELRAASVVVVLWSAASIESNFVQEEAILARNLEKLLPVRIELVDAPFGFQRLNTLDLIGWSGDRASADYQRVRVGVEGLMSRGSTPPVEEPPVEEPPVEELPAEEPPVPAEPSSAARVPGRLGPRWVGATILVLAIAAFLVLRASEAPPSTPPSDDDPITIDPAPGTEPIAEVEGVPIVPFDGEFLGGGHRVPLPRLTGRAQDEAWEDGRILDYLHYSLVLNQQRSLATFTAIAFDRTETESVRRQGAKWIVDPRAPLGVQRVNSLYVQNPWDRGHLVRRNFVTWNVEAFEDPGVFERAVSFFTATAPQHKNFNQRTWLAIEHYIGEEYVPEADRLILFVGPVFRDLDPTYRSTQIPRSYWMVAVAVNPTTPNLLIVRALLADQFEAESDGMPVLDAEGAPVPLPGQRQIDIESFTVPLATIAELTSLDFGYLGQYDVRR